MDGKGNEITASRRLCLLSHYYKPDVASTGQILADLAEGLKNQFIVTVICVVPSYGGTIEEKYKTRKYYCEEINGVKVIRIRVPEFKKNSKVSRIKNILSYFFGAMRTIKKADKQDYILSVSQPPILGGLLGVWGKWIKKAKFVYQIQDFNPEQIQAVNYCRNKWINAVMMWLDKFSCTQSDLVITVGRDLMDTLNMRFKGKNPPKSVVINNWMNEKEIYPLDCDNEKVLAFKKKYGLEDKFIIMYSGNIGLYYDLENLMKVIEMFRKGTIAADGREVFFVFAGAGSLLENLVVYKKQHFMDNVKFIPYQEKSSLIYSLNVGDVHWCVNAKGIKGVSCPSKYYGLAAAGKPVLAVLESGSEVRCLIEQTRGGLCCEPGNYNQVRKNIQWFLDHAGSELLTAMGKRGHDYLIEHLTREKSISKYAKEISNC